MDARAEHDELRLRPEGPRAAAMRRAARRLGRALTEGERKELDPLGTGRRPSGIRPAARANLSELLAARTFSA